MKNTYRDPAFRPLNGDTHSSDNHVFFKMALLSNELKPSAECKKLYFKKRFAAFIPYDILEWGFNGEGIPFDIRLYALFSSACWTAKTGKFTCNFWASTLIDYFNHKNSQFLTTAKLISGSVKRLNAGKHISVTVKEDRILEEYGTFKDLHLVITLKTRFDQKLRKVIRGADELSK